MTIQQIQCLLTYLGYSTGAIDGADGKNTQAAIRAFQANYWLTVDGIPGAATQKMLIGAIAGTAVKVEKPESGDAPKTGTFWNDIKYFTREEFRCPCGHCGGFPVEPQESMVRTVDEIRRRRNRNQRRKTTLQSWMKPTRKGSTVCDTRGKKKHHVCSGTGRVDGMTYDDGGS